MYKIHRLFISCLLIAVALQSMPLAAGALSLLTAASTYKKSTLAGMACLSYYAYNRLQANAASQAQQKFYENVDAPQTPYKNILFDLNDVLFKINQPKAFFHLGVCDTVRYTLSGKKPDDLRNKLFDVLCAIRHEDSKELAILAAAGSSTPLPMHKDRILPQLFCDWMMGIVPTKSLIAQINQKLDALPADFYSSETEHRLLKKIATIMFNPEERCALYDPIPEAITLLKHCKKVGFKVYLLSNMDSEIMALLKNKFPDVFALFDGMVISADVKAMKPHAAMFQHMLVRFNLQANECCFIDDEPNNIIGAEQTGITGVLFNYKKPIDALTQLADLGIFSTHKSPQQVMARL